MESLTEWIARVVEEAAESATCVGARDPADIISDIEEDLIETFNINLTGKELKR